MPLCVPYNRTARWGSSFIGTFYFDDADDMNQLENVRKMVSNMNKDLKVAGKDYKFYVKCQGRLGKNNPNAWKYKRGGTYGPNAGSVRLGDATRVDAYIYRRNPY